MKLWNCLLLRVLLLILMICLCLLLLRIIINLWMWILLVGIILVTTHIEETLILGRFLVIPLIIMVIPTTILMEIIIRCPLNLRLVLKNLWIRKRISMLCLKKNCLKLMIWLGTLIDFLLMLILWNLDLFHLSMISMSLSKLWEFPLMSARKNR